MKQPGASRGGNGRFWLILFILSNILAACSLINSDPALVLGDTTPLEAGAGVTLTCSPSCARHSQCGTTPEQTEVVLAGLFEPMTLNHNTYLPANQPATVQTSLNKTVQIASAETASSLLFYQVIMADNTKAGWVAGYCVAAQ